MRLVLRTIFFVFVSLIFISKPIAADASITLDTVKNIGIFYTNSTGSLIEKTDEKIYGVRDFYAPLFSNTTSNLKAIWNGAYRVSDTILNSVVALGHKTLEISDYQIQNTGNQIGGVIASVGPNLRTFKADITLKTSALIGVANSKVNKVVKDVALTVELPSKKENIALVAKNSVAAENKSLASAVSAINFTFPDPKELLSNIYNVYSGIGKGILDASIHVVSQTGESWGTAAHGTIGIISNLNDQIDVATVALGNAGYKGVKNVIDAGNVVGNGVLNGQAKMVQKTGDIVTSVALGAPRLFSKTNILKTDSASFVQNYVASVGAIWDFIIDKISDPFVPLFLSNTTENATPIQVSAPSNSTTGEIDSSALNTKINTNSIIEKLVQVSSYVPIENSDAISKLRYEMISLNTNSVNYLKNLISLQAARTDEGVYKTVERSSGGNGGGTNILAGLTGILIGNNGNISATETLPLTSGGTGLSTTPSYGQLLMGNSSGFYELVSTSTLGISAGAVDLSPYFTLADWRATTTDALAEGSTNKYYSSTLFANDLTATTSLSNIQTLGGLNSFGSNTATTTANGNLSVAGNINFNGLLFQNGQPFTNSQWVTNGSDISYSTGNVGIGTTSPVSQLANTSVNTLDGAGTGSDLTNGFTWASNNPGYAISAVNNSSATNANGLFVSTIGTASTNRILTLNANGADTFVVQGNGNVGVGTSNPSNKLSVQGTSDFSNTMTINSGTNSGLNIFSNDIPGGSMALMLTEDTSAQTYGIDTYGRIMRFADAADGSFYDAGIDVNRGFFITGRSAANAAFTIAADGNVGIGSSTPTSKLSVEGGGLFNGNISAIGLGSFGTLNAAGNVLVDSLGQIWMAGSHRLTDQYGAVLNASGNYISNPSGDLYAGDGTILSDTSGNFSANGSGYFGGNVGIGTSDPSSIFQVQKPGDVTRTISFTMDDPMITFANGGEPTGKIANTYGSFQFGRGDYSYFGINSSGAVGSIADSYMGVGFPTYRNILDDGSGNASFAGNVGVGSTTPGSILSIGNTGGINFNAGSAATSTFGGNLNVAGNINFNGSFLQNNVPFVGSQWTTSGSNISYSSGKIGIGTSTPTSKFTIVQSGTSAIDGLQIQDNGGRYSRIYHQGGNGLMFDDTDRVTFNTDAYFSAALSTASLLVGTSISNAGANYGGNVAVTDGFYVQNNVGVGSTTPWGQLSVNPNGITGPSFVVGSSTATNFIVTNGGDVGIGTSTPSATLGLQGSIGVNGTQLYLAANGNVGIGTASPSSRFSVGASSQFQIDSSGIIQKIGGVTNTALNASYLNLVNSGGDAIIANNTASANSNIILRGGQSSGVLKFEPVSGTEIMRILTTGVGIGTTTPWGQFSINPNGITGPSFVVGSSTATQFVVTNGGNVLVNSATDLSSSYRFQVNANNGFGAYVNGTIYATNTITSATNIGAPSFGCNCNGSLGIGFNGSLNSQSLGISLQALGGPITFLTNSAAEKMRLDVSGNLGIGTTTPWGQLSVNSNGISGPSFVIGSSTATSFIVDSGGNAGVGTTTPGAKFSVQGNGLFSGALTLGGALSAVSITTTGGGSLNTINGALYAPSELRVGPPASGGCSSAACIGTLSASSIGLILKGSSSQTGDLTRWINSSGATMSVVNAAGSFGVGTSSPLARLDVVGTNNGTTPLFQVSSLASFATTTRFFVDSGGNVAIGSASASAAKFQVTGTDSSTAWFVNTATHSSTAGAGIIGFSDSGGALSSGDRLGFFLLGGAMDGASTRNNSAGITSFATQSWSGSAAGANLQFLVQPNNTIGTGNRLAAMTVDQNGFVGVGSTTPWGLFSINPNGLTGGAPAFVVGSSTSVSLIVTSGGYVGIGTTTPAFPLDVYTTASSNQSYGYLSSSGTVGTASGANSYSIRAQGRIMAPEFNAVSDARLKNVNFELTSDVALNALIKLKPVSFNWKNEPTGQPILGFLAQDVESVIPNAVSQVVTGNFPDQRMLDYNQITAVMVGAVKEIKIELDALSEKVSRITAWFADGKFNVQSDVCVDDVCVSKEQFKQMLLNSGMSQTTVINDTPSDTPNNTSTTTEDTSTTTESTSTTTSPSEDVIPPTETPPDPAPVGTTPTSETATP
ncbi:MAG: tail fiber domain-containing protein [Patescibacteria group bacterium]